MQKLNSQIDNCSVEISASSLGDPFTPIEGGEVLAVVWRRVHRKAGRLPPKRTESADHNARSAALKY